MGREQITTELPPDPEPGGPGPILDKVGPTADECVLALWCHLGGYFTSFVVPLIIWLTKKDEPSFVDRHAREALNYQITQLILFFFVTVVAVGALVGLGLTEGWELGLMVGGVGWCLFALLFGGLETVLVLLASMAAYQGRAFRYPLTIRLV